MSVPRWPRSGRYWANIVWLSGKLVTFSGAERKTHTLVEELVILAAKTTVRGILQEAICTVVGAGPRETAYSEWTGISDVIGMNCYDCCMT